MQIFDSLEKHVKFYIIQQLKTLFEELTPPLPPGMVMLAPTALVALYPLHHPGENMWETSVAGVSMDFLAIATQISRRTIYIGAHTHNSLHLQTYRSNEIKGQTMSLEVREAYQTLHMLIGWVFVAPQTTNETHIILGHWKL